MNIELEVGAGPETFIVDPSIGHSALERIRERSIKLRRLRAGR